MTGLLALSVSPSADGRCVLFTSYSDLDEEQENDAGFVASSYVRIMEEGPCSWT